jgi:hypothetical protein
MRGKRPLRIVRPRQHTARRIDQVAERFAAVTRQRRHHGRVLRNIRNERHDAHHHHRYPT